MIGFKPGEMSDLKPFLFVIKPPLSCFSLLLQPNTAKSQRLSDYYQKNK